MKLSLLAFTFCMAPYLAFADEQPLDPALREALSSKLLAHFEGEFDAAKTPAETQIDLILENHRVESVQIDSDKADERFVHFPFRAQRAGGYSAVLDRDGKGIWRCLGFLFGLGPNVLKSKSGSFFDLSSDQGIGGGEYVRRIYCYHGGEYRETSSKKMMIEGH